MLKVDKFRLDESRPDGYICHNKYANKMTGFWYFLRDVFEGLFTIVPTLGLFLNKLLIAIGFFAFFGWMWYSGKNKNVEKFD